MNGSATQRYCVEFAKSGPARFLSHLDLQEGVTRAMRRAGLPLAFSQGFHPRPKLQFEEALPLGWTSECERLWFDLEQRYPTREALLRLQAVAPAGVEFRRLYAAPGKPRPTQTRWFMVTPHTALPTALDQSISAAFPATDGGAVVEAESVDGEWLVRVAPGSKKGAPSLKKVLKCILDGDVPADLQVRRVAVNRAPVCEATA